MKPKNKLLSIIICLSILFALVYAYKEYHRRPADLFSVKPVAITDAISLVSLYENDEQKANSLYLGKVVDVRGVISQINNQDTLLNIMLGKNGELHQVSCLLNSKYMSQVKKLKAGDNITIRGICTGYLVDVELNRCVLIDK